MAAELDAVEMSIGFDSVEGQCQTSWNVLVACSNLRQDGLNETTTTRGSRPLVIAVLVSMHISLKSPGLKATVRN